MNRLQRIKKLFSIREYLRRILFFFVLGISTFLAALLVKNEFWQDVIVQFALVFIAVGLVSITWDLVGGDPLEHQITTSFNTLDSKFKVLQQSIGVLSDISKSNIGIERIWLTRRNWEVDIADGLSIWKERVCTADKVEIVSNTFWTRWFHDESFRNNFFRNISRGCNAKIILYDPNSDVMKSRSMHEGDSIRRGVPEMESEIASTLEKIYYGRKELNEHTKGELKLGLTTQLYHLAQIIRADDLILVAIYLTGKTGSSSPTLQLRGPDSAYFLTYLEQIELLWQAAQEFNQNDLSTLLEINGLATSIINHEL